MKCSHFSSNVDNVTQAVCNVRRPSPRHRQQRLEFEKEYFENDSLLTNDYLGFEQLNSILETRQQTAIDSIVPTMDHSQTVTKIHTHINPDALKSDTFLKPKLKKLSSNRIFDERINTTDLVETETYKHACASSTDRMTFGEKKIPKNDSQSKFRSPNFKNASNVISSTSKTTRSAGFSMADIAALKSKFPPNSRLALSHLRGTPDSNYKNTFTSGSKFSFSTIPTSNSCSIRKRSFSEAPYLDHQITSCDIQPVQNYSKGYNTFIQSSSDADLIESSFKSCDELESFLMHTSTNVQMNSNVERPFGMDEYLVDLKDQSDMNLTNHELWTNLQKPFKNQVNDEKYPMIPSSSVVEDLESLLFTSDTTEIKHSKPYMDFNLVDPKPSVNLNTQYIQKIDPIELDPNFGFRQEPRSFISLAPKIPNYKSTVPKAKTPPCLSDDQNKDKLNNPRKKTNIRIAPNVVTNTGYLAGSITTQKFSKALENFPGVARSLVSQDQLQYQAFLNSILNSNDGKFQV